MPELLIAFFGMLPVIVVAGGLITRRIIEIRNRPKPELSNFEKHKRNFIETGDLAELDQMKKEMEGS